MKKYAFIAGIVISILLFFAVSPVAKADTVPLIQGTTPEIATQNGKILQSAINQASSAKTKNVTLPAAYSTLTAKSH